MHTLRFEEQRQRHHLVVLYRAEQEGHLIPVRQLAGRLQAVEEGQYLGMPVGGFALVVAGGQPHGGGHVGEVVLTWDDLLGEAEDARAVVPSLLLHPLVVEADDVRVRTVVDGQLDLLALPFVEQRGELQNVADGRAAKAVQALVVVAHHAEILLLARQQQEDAFLNGVGVLVLVHHQVGQFLAHLRQHFGALFQQLQRLVLNAGEVERVVLVQQLLILGEARGQRADFHFGGGGQRGDVERLLADLVEPLEQVFRLRPAARLVVAHDELGVRQFAEFLDALVQKVLLVELIEQREAALEPGELAEVLQQPQADGVEGAEVHLVQIELDAQIGQPVGNARGQLARGLVGEGDDKQRLRSDAFLRDEIDDALDQREGFTGTGACDDEHRAIGGEDGFELLGVGLGLKGGGAAGHSAPSSSSAIALPMRLAIH
ncbi:hypothetical protein D9M68_632400 [compost metagenome]